MGQFLNSFLGRTEEQQKSKQQAQPQQAQPQQAPQDNSSTQQPQQEPKQAQPQQEPKQEPKQAQPQQTAQEPEPEVIQGKPIKLPPTEPKKWHQTSLDFLEDLALATPETRAKTLELANGLRAEKLEFHRCYVHKKDLEGDYFTDEIEALDAWGSEYRSIFRLVQPEKDGKPQPLGRKATKEETRACLEAEAKAKKKAKKNSK